MAPPTTSPEAPPEPTKTTVFRSKLPDITITNTLPLHKYCFERLPEVADRPCLIDGDTGAVHTFADVDRTISRAAAAFRSRLGVARGSVVMNLVRNSPEFVFSFFAASRLGAAVTTANPLLPPADIAKQAAAAKASVIVTEAMAFSKVHDYAKENNVAIVTIDERYDGILHFADLIAGEESLEDEDDPQFDPDDVVALPYSSGTTGLPKGVMLTHRSLSTSVAQQVDGANPNIGFTPEDVILCPLPMFHIYSLSTIMMCGLRAGAAVVIMKKFEMEKMLDLVERHRVTIAPFVPPVVVMVAKSDATAGRDLSSVRMVMCGAASLKKETEDAFMAKLPGAVFGQGYGMTEAGPVLSMCLAFAREPFPVKSGACGTVVRNAEMKIVDVETGASLGRNEPGEICIRGEQIMKGYLNDPVATENTIRDGWLHTGDIGYVDNDDELFIVDRLKDMIKYKGFQVPPAELEALLLSHDAVADAAVVGMADELAGEIPVAFVVKKKDVEVTEEGLKQYVAKQVVYYKKIHRVFFEETIPKAPSGKILKNVLRQKLQCS